MLIAQDIRLELGGREVLSATNLAIAPGRLTAIVGPNGAGKTSLMRVLAGEWAPTDGTVVFEGQLLGDWPIDDLARRRAVLPQHSNLAFPFTVFEVVSLGLPGKTNRPARRLAVQRALAEVGLADYAGRLFQQLSGGERQRVHFARVLVQAGALDDGGQPGWLFLDEPTASLDLEHQGAILARAAAYARHGAGVVANLHDLNLALGFADRLIVLDRGRIAADGAPAQVLNDRLIAEVFRVGMRMNSLPEAGTGFVIPQTAPELRRTAQCP